MTLLRTILLTNSYIHDIHPCTLKHPSIFPEPIFQVGTYISVDYTGSPCSQYLYDQYEGSFYPSKGLILQ